MDLPKPPFVGRNDELEQLISSLGEAMHQNGSLVLISGEAGIGKTRLVDELESKGSFIDCIFLTGRCIPGLPSPYLPFIEAFEQYEAAHPSTTSAFGDSFFGRARQETSESRPESSPTWGADRALFSALDFIKKRSVLRPMVIRIEDLHWADSATTQMLHFLARNAGDIKLLLIGTYRPEDLIPDSSGRLPPFLDTLRIIRREGICKEICLSGLEPPDMSTLVTGFLGGNLESSVLDRVVEESEGNPLFAVETTKLLTSIRSIELVDGSWIIVGKKEIALPPTVSDVLLRRIDRIPKSQRKILELASVIGRYFDVQLIEKVCQLKRLALLEHLESLERDHQLIQHVNEVYQFYHDTIRQVTYGNISMMRRKELHHLIGEALEQSHQGELWDHVLAMHFSLAGDRERCVKYSVLAGESCSNKGAAIEAMPYLEQALRCSKGENRFQDYDMRAYQSMAMANMLLGKYDTAVEFLDQIVVGLGNENVSAKTWRYLAECWGGTRLGKGDQSKSLMYLARAEAAIKGDAAEEGEIAAARATFQLFAGDYQGAQRSFETAISIAKQCNNAESLSKNQAYLADVFLTVGKVEDALEMAEGALKNAESVPGYYGELEATYYLGMVHLHAGNSREAIRLLTKSADISLKIGEYTGLCWALTFLSLAYDANDDVDGALKAASRSYECAQTTESSFIMLNGISGLLHAKIQRGEMEDVERLYEKGVMIQKDFNWGMHSSTRCLLTAAMAEYQAAKGDWANSVKLFEESFHLAEGTPNGLLLEALGRTWYGKFLETRGNANEAKAQFVRAIELYRSLRNMVQADKIRKAHHL